MKIKKGDKVQVILGKDKGRTGSVERVFPQKNQVLVSGVNVYKKHQKASGKIKSGIIEITKPLMVSKVALLCPKCQQMTRVSYKFFPSEKLESSAYKKNAGEKRRICAKCKELI